jgi:hypothetical protein
MKLTSTVVALAMLCSSPSANAIEFYGGESLHKLCRLLPSISSQSQLSGREFADASQCLGYVAGVIAGISTMQAVMAENTICFPSGIEIGTAADIVAQYLRDRPQERHFSGYTLTYRALAKAYPCTGSSKP